MKKAIDVAEVNRRQVVRLNRLLLLIDAGRPIPRKHYHHVAAWLRFVVSELKKPPPKPKRAKHRPRSWRTVDALLMFGWKVVHGKQDETEALGDIANAFGLQSTRTISENAEFKANKAMILESFKRAHYKPRVKK